MRIVLFITCMLVSSVAAVGQEQAADNAPPVVPDNAAVAPQQPELERPQLDDPVSRLENRLDRIERRLEQQDAGKETGEQQVLPEPTPGDATSSRYRYQDGVWWYLLPSNRWVYWSDGRWVDHFAGTAPAAVVYRPVVPAYSYVPSYSYPRFYSSYDFYYPRHYASYDFYPTYRRSYYGGWGGWGSAIGLGLSLGHAFSHHHHHHGHLHLGHHHFGHHHHGHFGHHHGHHHHHHHHH